MKPHLVELATKKYTHHIIILKYVELKVRIFNLFFENVFKMFKHQFMLMAIKSTIWLTTKKYSKIFTTMYCKVVKNDIYLQSVRTILNNV